MHKYPAAAFSNIKYEINLQACVPVCLVRLPLYHPTIPERFLNCLFAFLYAVHQSIVSYERLLGVCAARFKARYDRREEERLSADPEEQTEEQPVKKRRKSGKKAKSNETLKTEENQIQTE